MMTGVMQNLFLADLLIFFLSWNSEISGIKTEKSETEEIINSNTGSCHYDLDVVWTREISNSLIAVSPLVADINADKFLDIISPAFNEEVAVLQGVKGQNLPGSNWPASLPGSSYHASPLMYDINSNGQDDVAVFSSDGEIFFFDAEGNLMNERTMRIPHLKIQKEWWDKTSGMRDDVLRQSIRSSQQKNQQFMRSPDDELFVNVSAHVLATPVIADLNQDGIIEELLVPVSYYFDTGLYRSEERLMELGISRSDLEMYLACGIVLFNLTTGEIYKEVTLDLTMMNDEFPAYVLFTPTVVDLDSEGGPLEIIVGTSTGNLHVLDHTGAPTPGFPLLLSTLHGQVTVEDLFSDGHLEMIVLDTSSNVMCIDTTGKELWDSQISGSSSAGSRLADINQDGVLDIVIATNDGHVWVLHGDTGKVLDGWPIDLGGRFLATPLITRLRPRDQTLDVIVSDYEGSLYIISGDGSCIETIQLRESSMTPVLAANLIPLTSDLELLIATSDGTLICLSVNNDTATKEGLENKETLWSPEPWHADTPVYNRFTYMDDKFGVRFAEETKKLGYVSGRSFVVNFEVFDNRIKAGKGLSFKVQIISGKIILFPQTTLSIGQHRLRIATPNRPIRSLVSVHLTNNHGQLFTDSFAVSFHVNLIDELQWLLFVPFLAMVTLLLLVHGYPEVDLLPMTFKNS
ncbi:protein DEFECTIVE IN EXINE FORMATION 1-like isoform X2 [Asterias rubens]|uniref:protein DEFECTIVE IN EXINE FORMATION 1-like isoform X2 n=1 Tax=Asterias rubens TaxID=7604 RepID=UPI0014554E59|nr:protein DEFECTIVE IN EXINE FORMATION 1-like isoform X2 [Asterias rubens]